MEGRDRARAYARADFSGPNSLFTGLFLGAFPEFEKGVVVDLGCGPAEIPILLAKAVPKLRFVAVDASKAMLEEAKRKVQVAGLGRKIRLLEAKLPSAKLPSHFFEGVIANSLLHHFSDPLKLWKEVKRLVKAGGAVLLMDLLRPPTETEARRLVKTYAAREPKLLQRDFHASLLSAFTIKEVGRQLAAAGLPGLRLKRVSDRHLAVFGSL